MFCKLFKCQNSRFKQDMTGAVTVDWVVLTAATVVLILLVMPFITDGARDAGADINAGLAEAVSAY